MSFYEALIMALKQLTTNKLRLLLTLLGVIIGITAVIVMMAVGNGAVATISGRWQTFGNNQISIEWNWRNQELNPKNLTERDYQVIKNTSKFTKDLMPYQQANTTVSSARQSQTITISGVGESFLRIQPQKLAAGRFFNRFEVNSRKNVVILGWQLAEELFPNQNPLGKSLQLQGRKFWVIGVFRELDDQGFGGSEYCDNMRLYLPITTLQRIFNYQDYYQLIMQPLENYLNKSATSELKGILSILYGKKNNFLVNSMEERLQKNLEILAKMNLFLTGLGGISLLVGGIGIMNIMLVSVKERTREIGIRKALGAKFQAIMLQFVLEAMLICLAGGIIGIILGFGISSVIKSFSIIPALVTLSSVLLAVSCSLIIGLFFGIYPAWKAARLDPITCLRYE